VLCVLWCGVMFRYCFTVLFSTWTAVSWNSAVYFSSSFSHYFKFFTFFHFSFFIFPFFSYFLFCISVKEGYLKMGTGSVSQLIKRNREDTVTGGSEVLSEMLPVYPIRPV
jgi:hypothetical protein